jgi:hypothetical protein
MKKFPVLCLAVVLIISLFNIQAVKGQKVVSGDLTFLKGQKSINVVFDYTGLKIEKETEAEFLAREASEKNTKEAGSGDKFKQDWEKDKTEKFTSAFKKVLGEELGIQVDDPNAKYTLIVYEINLTNKGWGNKFSGGNPASMDVSFKFVETANQSNALCVMSAEKVRYMATMGTLSQKIQGCLEYAARQIVRPVKKNL